jgi:hypothetical protein
MCNPSTPIGILDETPPKIDTQGAFRALKPTNTLFPHTHIIP